MKRRQHSPEQIIDKLAEADKLLAQTGLTELVGTHPGRNVLLNRENGRGCASGSCYYAGL